LKGIWIREERRDENYKRFLKEKRKSKVMRAITGRNFKKKKKKKEFFFQESNDDAALPAEVVGGGGVLGDRNSIFLSFSLKPKREASSPFLSHFLFLSLSRCSFASSRFSIHVFSLSHSLKVVIV